MLASATRRQSRREHTRSANTTTSLLTPQCDDNVRYITPPGTGFLPRETAQHHQAVILDVVREASERACIFCGALHSF